MSVLSTAVPATESVVVCPCKVIALLRTSWLVQVAVPAGMITVSPSTAEAMALLTSEKEGLRAVMLFACAAPEAAKSSAPRSALSFLPLGAIALRAEARWPYSQETTAAFGRSRNGEWASESKWHAGRPPVPQGMGN